MRASKIKLNAEVIHENGRQSSHSSEILVHTKYFWKILLFCFSTYSMRIERICGLKMIFSQNAVDYRLLFEKVGFYCKYQFKEKGAKLIKEKIWNFPSQISRRKACIGYQTSSLSWKNSPNQFLEFLGLQKSLLFFPESK